MKKLFISLALISAASAFGASWYQIPEDFSKKSQKQLQGLNDQVRKAQEQHAADMQKIQDKIKEIHNKELTRKGADQGTMNQGTMSNTMRRGPNTKYYVHGKEPQS